MTNRLTCAEAFRRLDDYLDRELSDAELADVAAHLDECATCASEFGLERELLDGIRERLRRIQAPSDLQARIARVIRDGQ